MKKSILLSTMALGCLMGWSVNSWAFTCNTPVSGWAFFTETMLQEHDWKLNQCEKDPETHQLCNAATCCYPAAKMDLAPKPGFLTMWIDPGMTLATAADAAVTYFQHKKSIKMDDALEDLQKYLEAADTKAGEDKETSLAAKEIDLLAPDLVIGTLQDDSSSFEDIRSAVIAETFQTGTCNKDCAEEKQSSWLLASVELSRAMADKVVVHTDDMEAYFQALTDDFNRTTPIALHQNADQTGTDDAAAQTQSETAETPTTNVNTQSPKIMWGHMAAITVDTLTQVNDLNVLYARDLEMHGLAGIHESGTIKISHPGSSS